jgi:hypothetical protein
MRSFAVALAFAFAASSAFATTKGLNQIVTPDLQPPGQLSISYQQVDPTIGDPSEVQLELGLTKRAEVAVFQGLDPNQTFLAAEFGLIDHDPYLLSAGFTNWSTGNLGHTNPQPFLIGGLYRGPNKYIAGWARVGAENELLLGYAWQATPRVLLAADYQSGSGNSLTGGFTYAITPNLSLNPALYLTNDDHTLHGYAVLSWTIKAF